MTTSNTDGSAHMTDAPGQLDPSWRRANLAPGFTGVLTGDLVVDDAQAPRMRRESPDLVAMLTAADVTIGNFESTSFDPRSFEGWPEAEPGGSWLASTQRAPADLRSLGFDMVSRANNHVTDWGVAGMTSTDELLDEAGLLHAGTGRNLSAARAPTIFGSRSGRIAMVSAATRFTVPSRATDEFGLVRARPGMNGIRSKKTMRVPQHLLSALRDVRDGLEPGVVRTPDLRKDQRNGTVTLLGNTFAAHDATHTAIETELYEEDVAAVCGAIRQAKQSSELVVFSLHTHEPTNSSSRPPDFMRTLAHDAVDAGADVVHGHGPHRLRGVEVYRGKPIFYSLGNFFFMENTQHPLTRETYDKAGVSLTWTEPEVLEHKRVTGVFADRCWYESVVVRCVSTRGGSIDEIHFHPIELHWQEGRDCDRGIPRLADVETGHRILAELSELSAAVGTTIEVRSDGTGRLAIPD